MRNKPSVFLSYAWSTEAHKSWAESLAARLESDGITVIFDQWDVGPGANIPHFMEKAVSESDYVLILCTPTYKTKSDTRKGGVGYEGDIMTAEVLHKDDVNKFIPILCEGETRISLPVWLMSKYALDFRSPGALDAEYKKLLAFLKSKRVSGHADSPEYRNIIDISSPISPEHGIKVVLPAGNAIPKLMRRMMISAYLWRYQGGTGTWFRAATLPDLAKRARQSNSTIEIYAQMLDPTDEELCYAYASYRRSLHSAHSDHTWTESRVKCEVLATVVMMSILNNTDPLLVLNLSFIPYYSSFRYDMSNNEAVVTTEDPRAPCLHVKSGTYYYEAYRSELVRNHNQARSFNIHSPGFRRNMMEAGIVTNNCVGAVLGDLGLSSYCTEEEVTIITNMTTTPNNKYD